MSHRSIWSLFLVLLMICSASAQTDEAEARFNQAYSLFCDSGRIEVAIPIWEQIAIDYSGTFWGAKALFAIAEWSDSETAAQVLERVINEYPDTSFEFVARLELALNQAGGDRALAVQNLDSFAESLGGPSLELIRTSRRQAAEMVRSLPGETQRRLYQIADAMWVSLAQHDGLGSNSERAEALPVALFIREVFAPLGVTDGTTAAIVRLSLPSPVPEIQAAIPPLVTIDLPGDGQVTGRRPQVQSTITGGDLTHTPLDIDEITLTFDGEDIKDLALFDISLGAPEPGAPFETIVITYTPENELSTGEHTVFLKSRTKAVGGFQFLEAEITRTFYVGSPPGGEPVALIGEKDSIVLQKDAHRNEGANALLTLEKINGKAARNAVGFDLSNVQTSGLTSATLVFTIDPNEHVNGWGNGETVTVQTVNTPWAEGNGKSFGLNNNQQVDGTGSGVTWFSPIDENISNNSANSVVQWDGGSLNANPATAPPVSVTNHQTGEISFDVTQDVLNGAQHGWLLSKDKENKGSKVSFYSKEGAAAAGNPDLAPRLILEYGPSADAGNASGQTMASAGRNYLKAITRTSERATVKEALQENATLAFAGQVVLTAPLSKTPVVQGAVQVAYRSWLNDSLILANLVRSLA